METKTGNKSKLRFFSWDPHILSYEWWKQNYELWKQQIQIAPNLPTRGFIFYTLPTWCYFRLVFITNIC